MAFQLMAEFLEGSVQDESHIADRKAGDFGDLLVGAVVLKFEFKDLLLIRAERFHQIPNAVREVLHVGLVAGFFLLGREEGKGGFVPEVEPLFFPEDVEGAIATDGVKPSFEVFPDFGVISDP